MERNAFTAWAALALPLGSLLLAGCDAYESRLASRDISRPAAAAPALLDLGSECPRPLVPSGGLVVATGLVSPLGVDAVTDPTAAMPRASAPADSELTIRQKSAPRRAGSTDSTWSSTGGEGSLSLTIRGPAAVSDEQPAARVRLFVGGGPATAARTSQPKAGETPATEQERGGPQLAAPSDAEPVIAPTDVGDEDEGSLPAGPQLEAAVVRPRAPVASAPLTLAPKVMPKAEIALPTPHAAPGKVHSVPREMQTAMPKAPTAAPRAEVVHTPALVAQPSRPASAPAPVREIPRSVAVANSGTSNTAKPSVAQPPAPARITAQPRSVQSQPRSVQSQPRSVQAQPRSVQAQPRSVQTTAPPTRPATNPWPQAGAVASPAAPARRPTAQPAPVAGPALVSERRIAPPIAVASRPRVPSAARPATPNVVRSVVRDGAKRAELDLGFPMDDEGAADPGALSPSRPALRTSELESACARAGRLNQRALMMAQRGALFSARRDFMSSLRIVAEALDEEQQTSLYSRSLAAGFTALREAEDFSTARGSLEVLPNVADIARLHRTPVLKGSAGAISATAARARYHNYAREQLAMAPGQEVAGSWALYGLGKVTTDLSGVQDPSGVDGAESAMVMYQAAILVDAKNYRATHELGVLLAKNGKLEDAKRMFLRSVAVSSQPITWRNLAAVHRQLGEGHLAQLAEKQSAVAQRHSNEPNGPIVAWVDPQSFARAAKTNETMEPRRTEPQRLAAPAKAPQPVVAEENKGITAWMPWGAPRR